MQQEHAAKCLRHSKPGKPILLDECFTCTSEESLRNNQIIDNELTKCNQVRLPVPADGHCIVRAFHKALMNEDCCDISSYTELLQDACAEIKENLSFYGCNISSDTNIAQELYEYQVEKVYSKDIVDLIVYALANCTKSTIVVIYLHENGVKRFEISPAREGIVSQRSVTLVRIGEHYEAVVSMKTSKNEPANISQSSGVPVIVVSENTPKKTKLKGNDTISKSCAERDDPVILESDSGPSPKKLRVKAEFEDASGSSSSFHDGSSDTDLNDPLSSSNPVKLTPNVWGEISVLKCHALPDDIDSNVVYELPFDLDDRMASSKDGRRWKRYMTSNRSGFEGIRRLARCAGSYKCSNSQCNFRKQCGPNLTHFDKANNCKFCGKAADYIPCSASKVWEFNDYRQSVRVYHHGLHTCPVVVKLDAKEASDALKNKFVANPDMKPGKAVTSIITEAIKEDRGWDDIESLMESLINPSLPKNVKQKVRKELNPEGHSFEAVQLLKEKIDEKDPLYIFVMNDSRFDGNNPTFVFSTSQEKMILASKMQRNSQYLLEREYCHFDGKHGRVRGMKTLTASVFHPLLGKMVRLAVMHCEHEDATNVALFWQLFNKALQAATSNSATTFQPYGYMMDEGGAEWAGLQRECGEQEVTVAKSCQFHYKQAVNREAGKLNSSKSKFEFKKIANSMLVASSPASYDKAYGKMVIFIKEKPTKRGSLKSWLDWWDERKQHVFNAFRTLPFTPTTNLSECLHSSWETTNASKLTLIDAVYDDIADSVKFAAYEKLLGHGSLPPPGVPTEPARLARERESQRRKAQSYAHDLVNGEIPIPHHEYLESNSFTVDPHCTHRHDKRAKKGDSGKKKAKSKSAYDDSASSPSGLSQSSSDEDDPQHASKESTQPDRSGRYRTNRSQQFLKNLSKAKSQRTRISVASSRNASDCHRIYNVTSAQVQDHSATYEVNICTQPSCSCPEGLKRRKDVCKHLLWVYMFVLGLDESSPLLQQVYLTAGEVKQMLKRSSSKETSMNRSNECSASREQGCRNSISSPPAGNEPRYLPASQAMNSSPFLLMLLKENVKVCAGCVRPNNTFRVNGIRPTPPYDIVVCHREIRQWKANGTIQRSPSPQNTYYHADISCIQKNNPDFQSSMLVISTDVKTSLQEEHITYLRQHFNITL